MAYAGSNNFSKKVGTAGGPTGSGNAGNYASKVAGGVSSKGEPSGTGGLGRGSIS